MQRYYRMTAKMTNLVSGTLIEDSTSNRIWYVWEFWGSDRQFRQFRQQCFLPNTVQWVGFYNCLSIDFTRMRRTNCQYLRDMTKRHLNLSPLKLKNTYCRNCRICRRTGCHFIRHTSILSRDTYCDTSGIRQNGIHYDILSVIQQSCRVTDNSCEVNKIQFTETCWL